MAHFSHCAFAWYIVGHLLLAADSLGPLPDASQEGLLWPWKGYSSVALFHYHVPKEATRATWEFASFQDAPDCPKRQVHVWIQYGSYPVINASSVDEFPTSRYYTERSNLEWLTLESAHKPADSVVHPVYNPMPGSWFIAAYLEPMDEPLGFLQNKCRYSLGSIALWTNADNVDLIQPNRKVPQIYTTRKHFSYYKFFVPEDISQFVLTLSNCSLAIRKSRPQLNNESCIEYVGLRATALPLHKPSNFQQEWRNLSSGLTATFTENRPFEATYYYVLVVSHGRVSFHVDLQLNHCGESGLYGPGQRDWYLNERGLIWDGDDVSNKDLSSSRPKEPTTGFQLFSSRSKIQQVPTNSTENYDDGGEPLDFALLSNDPNKTLSSCVSKFDFTRVEGVRPFNVIYMVQGRSWYTKWLTVLEQFPVFTRFETADFIDLGGSLNVRVTLDTSLFRTSPGEEGGYYYQVVTGCISKDRQPRVLQVNGVMVCDNHAATLKVANLDNVIGTEALKVIPFPEPGRWHLGFQLSCRNASAGKLMPCPKSSVSAMVSVDINIQPCDHRPLRDACGGGGRGVCATNHKGSYTFSACACAPGYRGWFCDRPDPATANNETKTLLLTLSNFFFIPAILLAWRKRLYGQGLVYLSTMIFSIFYHACDQESFTGHLPVSLQTTCLALYVNQEVLQFCDFFSALLSFWVTVVSLANIPAEVVNACNLFGSLLIAFLVQYNRTGKLVLVIPVPLGLAIWAFSYVFRSFKLKRLVTPSRRGLWVYTPAIICLGLAAALATVAGTNHNYPYVHSGWHALIALSLSFLVLRCKAQNKSYVSSTTDGTTVTTCSAGNRQNDGVGSLSEEVTTITTPMTNNGSAISLVLPTTAEEVVVDFEATSQNIQSEKINASRFSYIQNFRALLARHDSSGN